MLEFEDGTKEDFDPRNQLHIEAIEDNAKSLSLEKLALMRSVVHASINPYTTIWMIYHSAYIKKNGGKL